MAVKDTSHQSVVTSVTAMFVLGTVIVMCVLSLQSYASPKQPEPKTVGPKIPVIAPPIPPRPTSGPVFRPRPPQLESDRRAWERFRAELEVHRQSVEQNKDAQLGADLSDYRSGIKEYRKGITEYKELSRGLSKGSAK